MIEKKVILIGGLIDIAPENAENVYVVMITCHIVNMMRTASMEKLMSWVIPCACYHSDEKNILRWTEYSQRIWKFRPNQVLSHCHL